MKHFYSTTVTHFIQTELNDLEIYRKAKLCALFNGSFTGVNEIGYEFSELNKSSAGQLVDRVHRVDGHGLLANLVAELLQPLKMVEISGSDLADVMIHRQFAIKQTPRSRTTSAVSMADYGTFVPLRFRALARKFSMGNFRAGELSRIGTKRRRNFRATNPYPNVPRAFIVQARKFLGTKVL